MVTALVARGVRVVDLRPILRAARVEGSVYFKHDTHWTALGAIAAFNAVAAAAGHGLWVVDPDSALQPHGVMTGGDLARFLGLSSDLSEEVRYLAYPALAGGTARSYAFDLHRPWTGLRAQR